MKIISRTLVLATVSNTFVRAQDPCSICPFGQVVTLPDAIVPEGTGGFILTDLTCAETEALAQGGEFSLGECVIFRASGVPSLCGCSDGTVPTSPAPVEPETPVPVEPVTPAPVTPGPTSKVETSEPTEAPVATDSPTATPPETMSPTTLSQTTLPECGVNEVTAVSGEPVTIPPCIDEVDKTTVTTWPRNGSLSVHDDGSIIYVPNDNFVGQDVIEVETCNVSGNCFDVIIYVEVVEKEENSSPKGGGGGGGGDGGEGLAGLAALAIIPIAGIGYWMYRNRKSDSEPSRKHDTSAGISTVNRSVGRPSFPTTASPQDPPSATAKPMPNAALDAYTPHVKDQCRNVPGEDTNSNLPLAAAVILEETSTEC